MAEETPEKAAVEAKASGPSVSRRGVVYGVAGVAALVALGGAGKALAGEGDLLRPPSAAGEDTLLGACIKCDRCRSACPHNVIGVAHLEHGLVNARTPIMTFKYDHCDFCEDHVSFRCVDECPTGALLAGFDPAKDKIGLAAIDTDECLLFRSIAASCSKQCIPACPYGALDLDEAGHIRVAEDKCNGCGACEAVCPSASYTSYTGSNRRGINVEVYKAGE